MSRKISREKALELLFGMSISKDTPEEIIEIYKEVAEEDLSEVDFTYIKMILDGVNEKKEEITSLIEKNLQNWKIERVAKINLCILEMAIYEMKYVEDVPGKVAVNEALELGKRYSDEKSVSFINGILDKVLKEV